MYKPGDTEFKQYYHRHFEHTILLLEITAQLLNYFLPPYSVPFRE